MQPALTEGVYYILLSLLKPMHGYGIMQNTERLSGGRVKLAAGTLYGALNTLLEKGWIRAVPTSCTEGRREKEKDKDSRKKEYMITDEGQKTLAAEVERLTELVRVGSSVIEEASHQRGGIQ